MLAHTITSYLIPLNSTNLKVEERYIFMMGIVRKQYFKSNKPQQIIEQKGKSFLQSLVKSCI